MRRSSVAWLSMVGCVLTLSACGSSSSSGGTGGGAGGGSGGGASGYATVDALCADYPTQYCAFLVRCGVVDNQATCTDSVGAFFNSACGYKERPAIKDGRETFDGAAGGRCIASLKTSACSDFSPDTPDCVATFVGKVADNATCYDTSECAHTSYCTASSKVCPGTCKPRKAAGVAATPYVDDECQTGLYAYDDGHCFAKIAIGASCAAIAPSTSAQQCVTAGYCNASKICTAKKAAAATCATDNECLTPNVCGNGTCGLAGALNATCNTSPRLPCKSDLICDQPSLNSPGVCKAQFAAGAACASDFQCKRGLSCAGYTATTKGTCATQKAAGQTCMQSSQCVEGLFCNAGSCSAKKAAGAACASYDECGPHLSCNNLMCAPDGCYDPTP